MDDAKIAEFSERYSSLSEWEILDIDSRRDALTEEACLALDQTIARKKINLSKLKAIDAEEELQRSAQQQEAQRKAVERESWFLKLLWFVGLPMILVAAALSPGRFVEVLASSFVQLAFIGLIHFGYLVFKRTRRRR